MRRLLSLLALPLVACSDADPSPSSPAPDSGSNVTDAAGSDGAVPPDGGAWSNPAAPNPLLSENVPAFASSGNAKDANDTNPASAWGTSATSGFIVYDLSGAPKDERQRVLVSWNAIHAPCYIDTGSSGSRPIDYVIESNAAPSASAPPTSGWTPLLTITQNRYCARQHLVDLGGANWIRMSISKSTSDGIGIDLAVHGAKSGASDAWLFMGDSITYMSLTYAFSDLPALVRARAPKHVPAVIDAAIGGTNTGTALDVIDDTMKDFPGRFVVLAYGTNDHAKDFQMEELVQHVLAAGKTPVVPHMPWASGSAEGAAINQQIDALYLKYPQIAKGPDLWKTFEGHLEWIPQGDVHPNGAGQQKLREAWADAMVKLY
jgi:lysophospholipase L1-like esterase